MLEMPSSQFPLGVYSIIFTQPLVSMTRRASATEKTAIDAGSRLVERGQNSRYNHSAGGGLESCWSTPGSFCAVHAPIGKGLVAHPYRVLGPLLST